MSEFIKVKNTLSLSLDVSKSSALISSLNDLIPLSIVSAAILMTSSYFPVSSQRMVVMIDKLKSLPTDTSEQLIGTFISVIDNLGVLAGGGK